MPLWNEAEAAAISAADPLAFDSELAVVRQGNVPDLASALERMAERARGVPPDPVSCHAALRDLGLVLGALRRTGVDPVDAVPAVGQVLLGLGKRVDMVPRDTVLHYGPWNPSGTRQRSFTGSAGEGVLIQAVRTSAPALHLAIDLLHQAHREALRGADPTSALLDAAQQLATVVSAMRVVAAELPATYFAASLRPYFDEVVIGGQRLSGPAAAQLPTFVIDRLVWNGDGVAHDFQDSAAAYGTRQLRDLYLGLTGEPPLLALLADPAPLRPVLRRLVELRGVHLAHARKSYLKVETTYSRGSAGGTVDLLDELLTATRRSYRDTETTRKA